MSTIPAKETERDRDEPDGWDHTCDGKEVRCFASGGGT
jgi:hypothetical protein